MCELTIKQYLEDSGVKVIETGLKEVVVMAPSRQLMCEGIDSVPNFISAICKAKTPSSGYNAIVEVA